MKRNISSLTVLLLVALTTILLNAQTVPDADALLKKSDESRAAWDSYQVMTVIKNYDEKGLKEEGKFEVMNKGTEKTLVRFLNADEKGQFLLVYGDAMWMYMPNTKKPIRITPLQRLLGNASNGDVARTRYYGYYNAKFLREDKLNSIKCNVLLLTAKNDGATYQKIEYWLSKEDTQPQKAEIYLSSGKHYKSIYYDKYSESNGKMLLDQLSITERLQPGKRTTMTFSNYQPKELPERIFNKDYLEKMK